MTTENPNRLRIEPAIWPGIVRIAVLVLRVWPERRRQRARLRDLEPHQLRDIGISRTQAMREARKPFWR